MENGIDSEQASLKNETQQMPGEHCSRLVLVLFSSIIAVLVIVVFALVRLNNSIQARNEIVLTVPDSLQQKIVAEMASAANNAGLEYQRTLDASIKAFEEKYQQLAAELSQNVNKSISGSQEESSKKLDAIVAEAQSKLDEIRSKHLTTATEIKDTFSKVFALENDELKSRMTKIESEIHTILNANATKANDFLEAARKCADQEIKKLLYSSALAYSENKSPVLKEYIEWQGGLLTTEMEQGNLADAQKRFLDIVALCDANMINGSLADFESIQDIKSSLLAIDKRLADAKHVVYEKEREKVNVLSKQVAEIDSYANASLLLDRIENTFVPEEQEGEKERLISQLKLKMSYLTNPSDDIIVPSVSNETPWIQWGENFLRRLQSKDISLSRKLEDLGAASDFLQAAKQNQDTHIKQMMERLEVAIKDVYVAYWQERVDAETSKGDSASPANISELLNEGMALADDIRTANMPRLQKLNKTIVMMSLAELDKNIKYIKSLESQFNEEVHLQMISVIQGQFLQLRIRLEGLNQEFPHGFDKEISLVTQKINAFQTLYSGFRDKQLAMDLSKNNRQRQQYLAWVKSQMDEAERLFKKGEKIADTWSKTTGSSEAQHEYYEAWKIISHIHPGDLQGADPALYLNYEKQKMQIENRREPSDKDLKSVTYKRLSDFQ
ncbi:MAG: hypothetical protein GX561_13340 [Lentisphaerae bacterium]|nr:hypothetical protein [Lentisphaerota bacterium]